MPAKDYYKILGVDKSASQDEIKSAYRKLAKQYHPDLHPGDNAAAEKFKECNEAYSVVGDPEKRVKYDRGELDMDGAGFNPFSGQGFSATGFDDIFDIFSGFMGGGSRTRTSSRTSNGGDINYTLDLSFMESATGCKKSINFSRFEKCPVCGGTGAKDASHIQTCDKCHGSGQVRYTQNTIFGQQVTIGVCDKCGGSGKIVTETCKNCGGKTVVSKNKIMNVTIPAGVENGSILQIAGEGNAARGQGGRNGNLLLVINIKSDKVFKRENVNLYTEIPVPFITAACGGDVKIPSLEGVFVHRIPEGTQNGEVLRFRGKGIRTRGSAGDLFVTVKVEVPKGLSRDQKKCLEDFEKQMTSRSYQKSRDYYEDVSKLYNNK